VGLTFVALGGTVAAVVAVLGVFVGRARRTVRREAIDIDLVLEEKYPNRRAARDRERRRVLVTSGAPAAAVGPDEGVASRPMPMIPIVPADRSWPAERPVVPYFPPPAVDLPPWAPIPGEPGADLVLGPPRRPGKLTTTPEGPRVVASPYESLRRRRDRVAAQAAAAFAEVHRIRTESLRRASQAEHNAELATTARSRAARMAREARRYEAQGRARNAAVPDATDAFDDVHRFRVEALRRAHEAEHGAEVVAQARARAGRLLKEQRRIEAEMRRLERGRLPGEPL